MTITLYNSNSDRRTLTKDIVQVADIDNVNLLDDCNIISPVFLLSNVEWASANYLYCSDFKRYYYIDNVEYVPANLIRLRCSCDVLMSFKNDILKSSAIVQRGGNNINVLLSDSSVKSQANSVTVNKAFSNCGLLPRISSENYSFVLTVYGGENVV